MGQIIYYCKLWFDICFEILFLRILRCYTLRWCNFMIYKSSREKITSLFIQTSFFMCKWFSTGGSLISDFPKSTLAWHLVDEMLVYGCCYGSKMMVCWRSENWPSFLYGPAKNFSCSVKNYDLLIVTLGRKIDFMLTEISKCVWPSPIDFSNKVKKSWTKKSYRFSCLDSQMEVI